MGEAVARIARSGRGRQYVYAYYPDVDANAHDRGMASARTRAEVERVDRAFAALLQALRGTDTAVVATADHGFVDSPPARQIELDRHPALADALVLPLCGEPRVAYAYVHPERTAAFARAVADALEGRGRAHRSADLIASGAFGPGAPHPRLGDRVGHYAIVMADDWTLRDRLLGERRHPQIGAHGGTSEWEMRVPLIVASA
jgi:arylsulfatase A-like enzyme